MHYAWDMYKHVEIKLHVLSKHPYGISCSAVTCLHVLSRVT